MKWLAVFTFFFSMNLAAAPQSFEILLTGKTGAGPHPNEERAVRQMIAGLIENLHIQKYILRPTPANGGFQVCLQPVDDRGYRAIVFELEGLAIRESLWDVSLVDECLSE